MSKQTINIGTTPSDGTGDSLRAAFTKANANFTELYDALDGTVSSADLDAEATAREAADALKADASALTAEATARQNADTTLQNNLNTEATARAAADALKADASALTAEASSRAAADTTLQNNLNAEATARAAADALKADLVGGKVPTSQIPAIAISSYLGSVDSEATMLTLDGQSGDWCNRSDTSTAWVITGDDPTQLSSWAQINYPVAPVTSVNGQTGVIVLGKADLGLDQVDNTTDLDKPVSTAVQNALDLKADTSALDAKADAADLTSLASSLSGLISDEAATRGAADTTLQNNINAKAPLASPALTGTPTAPTASTATNTTQIATTAYVQSNLSAKADLVGGKVPSSQLPAVAADFAVACSDETTALTTGTAKVTFRMPYAMNLTAVRLSVNTAPSLQPIIVDVKQSGTSIFSTKPNIDAGATTSVGGSVPGTLSTTALTDDAEITINIDQVGSFTAGKGLKVTFKGTR